MLWGTGRGEESSFCTGWVSQINQRNDQSSSMSSSRWLGPCYHLSGGVPGRGLDSAEAAQHGGDHPAGGGQHHPQCWRLLSQTSPVVLTLARAGVNIWQYLISRYFGARDIKCLASLLNGAVPIWIRKFHIVNHPRFLFYFSQNSQIIYIKSFRSILWHGQTFPKW